MVQRTNKQKKLNIKLSRPLECPRCGERVIVPNIYGKINDLYQRESKKQTDKPDYMGVRIELFGTCSHCGSGITYIIDCHNSAELGFTADVYKTKLYKKGFSRLREDIKEKTVIRGLNIDRITEAERFTALMSQIPNIVDAKRGRYTADAKSLLSIAGLCLGEPSEKPIDIVIYGAVDGDFIQKIKTEYVKGGRYFD